MYAWFTFFIKNNSSIAEAMEELLLHHVENLSLIEEETCSYLCGQGLSSEFPSCWTHIKIASPISSVIVWEDQWKSFCPYFNEEEGACTVPLSDFIPDNNSSVKLLPGPGFGDLSHPTTTLVLRLMDSLVTGKICLDLGCGSGILGLAALRLGAAYVYAIDIDLEAVEHTRKNALLNDLNNRLSASANPKKVGPYDLVLLNMIYHEQKEAIASIPNLSAALWITSGILQEQKSTYLTFMNQLGLKASIILEQDGWLGFVFSRIGDA